MLTEERSIISGFEVWKLRSGRRSRQSLPVHIQEERERLPLEEISSVYERVSEQGDDAEEPLNLLFEHKTDEGWMYLFPIDTVDDLETLEASLDEVQAEIEEDVDAEDEESDDS